MPYCRYCGFKIPEDTVFCPNCGGSVLRERLGLRFELASWAERIVAYFIDILILGLIVIPITSIILWPWAHLINVFRQNWGFGFIVSFSFSNVISFLYWTFLEGVYGQSIGKIALKIKVVKVDGKPMDIVSAAIESLGKSFLLPIDLILGLIIYPQRKQRLFNYVSNTIVVKAQQ